MSAAVNLQSISTRLCPSGSNACPKVIRLSEEAEPEIRDAGLIVAAQKMEHYEIAGYGSLAAYAKLLGFNEDAALLLQTLQEEKATDDKLNLLAKNINIDAAEGEIAATA